MANLLIVDDKESILDPYQYHFHSIGWHAEVARNGQQAIDLLKEKGTYFDGIILDKNMPRKTGDQVVQWLYENEFLDDICVVLLTGFPEMQSAIDALRMGVWQYLVKDMTPTEIQTFIAPGIAQKKVHRMRRQLWDQQNLPTVLDRIQTVVHETLAPDGLHIIFLSPFLSRDLSDGSSPSPNREFVRKIAAGSKFISARSRAEVASLEPVLPGAGTLMAVPVEYDHSLLGVLEMESLKEQAFDPRWKEVLNYFAEIVSLTQSIYHQRLLAEEKAKHEELARTNGELRHRIANSLGIIQQNTRELGRDNLSETARQRMNSIMTHSIRIENVLKELKDLSITRPVTVEKTNVVQLVRDVAREFSCPSDVRLDISTVDQEVLAQADNERLRDTLVCMINNSLEAIDARRPRDHAMGEVVGEKASVGELKSGGPAAYWVRVTLFEDDRSVRIAIADNGVGFDKEIHDRLFNALFSTKTRRENLNTGYGLYTSLRVIRAMGGWIDASSPGPYQGATFTIHLLSPKE